MKKICIALCTLIIALFLVFNKGSNFKDEYYTVPHDQKEQNFDVIDSIGPDPTYMSYSKFRNDHANASATATSIITAAQGKKIRFDTAEELYRFSIDVSFNPKFHYESYKFDYDEIGALLSLNYVLGNNIDYSVMKSKQFIPIGFSFKSIDTTEYNKIFTGTFDGRGFEIKNLYVAGYEFVTITEGEAASQVDTALSPYYSMFTHLGETGVIKNLGLVNPTLELIDEHMDITKTATLVGLNKGIIDHVYVIDTRTNPSDAGIRFKVPSGTNKTEYTAAGIVYENQNTFTNAYFASQNVVNGLYINQFLAQPVLYTNQENATIDNLVFDSEIYIKSITVDHTLFYVMEPNGNAKGEETQVLRTASVELAGGNWYYYESDTYPILLGLTYEAGINKNHYLIEDSIDLIAFSKLLNFKTFKNGKLFRNSDYVLTNNIDMSQVAEGAYVTPSLEFTGTLSGLKSDETNWYIYNLSLINGAVYDGSYFTGLFSTLSGQVNNITFGDASIVLNNTNGYYSSTFKVGVLAGEIFNGEVNNVYAKVNIDLGNKSIDRTYLGGLAGKASGAINGVYIDGVINGGIHIFSAEHKVTPQYYIGGVIGSADSNKLTLYNVLNKAKINGIGTTAIISTDISEVSISIGGIIGELYNNTAKHDLGSIVNSGNIFLENYKASVPINQYVGGIFGISRGSKYALSNTFGDWVNNGTINAPTLDANTKVRSAGIGVSNHDENVEYIYLKNYGNFSTLSFDNFTYTSLIYDMGTTGLIVSQSTNYSNYSFNKNISDFSPVVFIENQTETLLRYVENKGNLTYYDFTLSKETFITGITQFNNTNFLNVYYSGNIHVYNINSIYPLWVSGITYELQTNKYIKNSINEGNIRVANIDSTANTYVGGLVNKNNAIDLQFQDDIPGANEKHHYGIINSINYATLTSTILGESGGSNIFGIKGVGNIYAGGIATLNSGSIQDTANMGNINFANISDLSSDLILLNTDEEFAGIVTQINGGVTVGGVTAIVTSGKSRIYDCSNNGEIIGIANNFVRSGGILAVSLYLESEAGGVTANVDTQNSILSNCINYGDVGAITKTIGTYTNEEITTSFSYYPTNYGLGEETSFKTRKSTNERPGIYASAGGIIAYGLCIMRRMINHGNIFSTDIAGGVVGATYVLGGTGNDTIVNIDTAIHYGSVRAVKSANYNSINKENISYTNVKGINSANLYDVSDAFIFPVTINNNDITQYPESKRGLGGIFGRLQRGRNGKMTSVGGKFDFIVNADTNVDLIGRLDQVYNFTSSARYFIFVDCLYYSARENDTTQAVFTGYKIREVINTKNDYTILATRKVVTNTRTSNGSSYIWREKTEYLAQSGTINTTALERIRRVVGGITSSSYTEESRQYTSNLSNVYVVASEIVLPKTGRNSYSQNAVTTQLNPAQQLNFSTTFISNNTVGETIEIPGIRETKTGTFGEDMYDPNFIMRNPPAEFADLTSYIYYVEGRVLSDTFAIHNPNGMYVLSTSEGSTYGSVLPANMNIINIQRISKDIGRIPFDTDYTNVKLNYKEAFRADVTNKYLSLFQTKYSDKSSLLEDNEEIILEEIGGSGTKLINPLIDHVNKKITYEISLEAFDSELSVAEYRVLLANISNKALIAARIEDYDISKYDGTANGFRELLMLEKDKSVSENVIPSLSVNFKNYNDIVINSAPISIGYFNVYSEAAINNILFWDEQSYDSYITEYEVRIVFKPRLIKSGGEISISNVKVDNTDYTRSEYINFLYPAVNNTIKFSFTDSKRALTNGTDIKNFVSLDYAPEGQTAVTVDAIYYNLDTEVVNNGLFSFTITMKDELRKGRYIVRYKFFSSGEIQSMIINNGSSSNKNIEKLSHYSYDEYVNTGTSFTTYVNFGKDLDLDNLSYSEIPLEDVKPYLNGFTYSVSYLSNFKISPFATIKSINVINDSITGNPYTYDDEGYRIYTIIIKVLDEDLIEKPFTHTIKERRINVVDVLKNNNRVTISNIFAEREASSTIFAIDFGIDSSYATDIYNLIGDNPNSYFALDVRAETFTGTEYPLPLEGLKYSTDVLLYITMDYPDHQALPGFYYFTITYHRDGKAVTISEILTIKKNEGVNAYLKDIRFSQSGSSVGTTEIFVSNSNGVIDALSVHSPRVYYAGIDYDNADTALKDDFRINGQVANVPLHDYAPYLLDYLPYGAKISRHAYDHITQTWYWTEAVDAKSSEDKKALLSTDFTVFPDTGLEGGENNDVLITYKVISESGSKVVFYHISVIDIKYNVSLIFNIYYGTIENGEFAYNSSELRGKTIIINVKNFVTDTAIGESVASDVDNFLDFSEIIGDYNNNTNQFFVPQSEAYKYSFGRNISGFYSFNLTLPKDINGRNLYTYFITFNGKTLPNMSSYITGAEGKYYYVEAGTKNRTRRFNIYITKLDQASGDPLWGLTDYYKSWEKGNTQN